MKLPEEPSINNPLLLILNLFSKEPAPLTNKLLDAVIELLKLGNIICENRDEAFKCLDILKDMDLITLTVVKESKGTSFLIGIKS